MNIRIVSSYHKSIRWPISAAEVDINVKEVRAPLALFLNTGFPRTTALRKIVQRVARSFISPIRSPTLPAARRHTRQRRCSNLSYGLPNGPNARFSGTARHRLGQRAAPRYRKRSNASFPIISGRPATEPGSTSRHPRALRTPPRIAPLPWGRHVINRWLLFGATPLFVLCLSFNRHERSLFPFSSVAHLRPCSRPSELRAQQ